MMSCAKWVKLLLGKLSPATFQKECAVCVFISLFIFKDTWVPLLCKHKVKYLCTKYVLHWTFSFITPVRDNLLRAYYFPLVIKHSFAPVFLFAAGKHAPFIWHVIPRLCVRTPVADLTLQRLLREMGSGGWAGEGGRGRLSGPNSMMLSVRNSRQQTRAVSDPFK